MSRAAKDPATGLAIPIRDDILAQELRRRAPNLTPRFLPPYAPEVNAIERRKRLAQVPVVPNQGRRASGCGAA